MGGTVSVPGLHGTFTNLEGVIGSPFNDTLIGRDGGSTFHVTGLNQGTWMATSSSCRSKSCRAALIPIHWITLRCPARSRSY